MFLNADGHCKPQKQSAKSTHKFNDVPLRDCTTKERLKVGYSDGKKAWRFFAPLPVPTNLKVGATAFVAGYSASSCTKPHR